MFIRSIIYAAMTVVFLTGLSGCEESVSGADVNLPYREELVVQGFLTADSETDTILITRTLPPLEKWTAEKAAVTDAAATITVDGTVHPLIHTGRGQYRIEGLRPVVGKSYTLNVAWKNLKVSGTASIPVMPEVVGLSLDTIKGGCDYYFNGEEEYSADAIRVLLEYLPHGANMNSARLGITYSFNDEPQYSEDGYNYFFYEIDSSGVTNKAIVNERCYSRADPFTFEIDTLFLHFVEYEGAFRSYFDTRWSGDDDNLFFGPSGEHPAWNVTGNGFGWFFGRSTLRDTTVLR